ncbi:MAG: hypothetical protein ACE5IP_08660 [Terriglobia bacterium]
MKLTRNLGRLTRVAYISFGLGLVMLALLAPSLHVAVALAVGVVGGVVALEGTVGF